MIFTDVFDSTDLILTCHYKAFSESAFVSLLLDLEGYEIVHESTNTVTAASDCQVEDNMKSADSSSTLD